MRKIFGFVLCLSVALFSAGAHSFCGDDDNDGNGKSGSVKKKKILLLSAKTFLSGKKIGLDSSLGIQPY